MKGFAAHKQAELLKLFFLLLLLVWQWKTNDSRGKLELQQKIKIYKYKIKSARASKCVLSARMVANKRFGDQRMRASVRAAYQHLAFLSFCFHFFLSCGVYRFFSLPCTFTAKSNGRKRIFIA